MSKDKERHKLAAWRKIGILLMCIFFYCNEMYTFELYKHLLILRYQRAGP